MPYDPKVTFEDSERARMEKLSIAKSRRVPEMLGLLEEAKSSKTYHIFNVGPWPHVVRTGSTGDFFIPGCKEGEEYSEMSVTIPGIVDELVIKNEAEYDRLMDDGWKFCLEIVGDGRGQNPANSIRRMGVFPSKTATPSAEDLKEAKRRLHEFCAELVGDARDLFAVDRSLFAKAVRREVHFVAANVLGLTNESWMVNTTPKAQSTCPYCTVAIPENAIKCPNCKEVVNPGAYLSLRKKNKQEAAE